MTKETRALIEAAEYLNSHRHGRAAWERLQSAVSSAKAAEEGVETEHCPRCRSAVRGIRLWVSGWTEPNCKHEWHDAVREKEGL